ncbi:hypothetical protein [Rhizobium sp. PP-F2F-G48]|uniref:hypothetical protein n=1 Tax=Rhizobium sp. PP-F2F-G48 TaxID=2135651 RepID=UPI001404EEB4|nr:hypothetical protein [Rhizobium sp. PP-F2F-G48]
MVRSWRVIHWKEEVGKSGAAAGRIRLQKPEQKPLKDLSKSAVERPGNTRVKACRQALVILQHDDILRATSELGFHDRRNSSFQA